MFYITSSHITSTQCYILNFHNVIYYIFTMFYHEMLYITMTPWPRVGNQLRGRSPGGRPRETRRRRRWGKAQGCDISRFSGSSPRNYGFYTVFTQFSHSYLYSLHSFQYSSPIRFYTVPFARKCVPLGFLHA